MTIRPLLQGELVAQCQQIFIIVSGKKYVSQLSKLSILTSDFYNRDSRYASQKYAHIFNICKDHPIKVTFLSRLSLIMTWANLESVLAINIDCWDRARASTSHFCFRRTKAGVLVPAPDQKP